MKIFIAIVLYVIIAAIFVVVEDRQRENCFARISLANYNLYKFTLLDY